jgi:hypothetical protein
LLRCAGLHLEATKEASRVDALEIVRHTAAAAATSLSPGKEGEKGNGAKGGKKGGKSSKAASSKGRGSKQLQPQQAAAAEETTSAPWPEPSGFLLHVVCAHGAVVRDGPEIDTCATVDTREMGAVLWATERRAVSQVTNETAGLRRRGGSGSGAL